MTFIPYEKRKYGPLGPKTKEIIEKTDKYSSNHYARYSFAPIYAKGPWLYDADGNKALDFLAGYSSILTHKLDEAFAAYTDEYYNGTDLISGALYNKPYAEFLELITNLTGYDKVNPKSDGGTATDSAISALLNHGKPRGIKSPEAILIEQYFHGRTWIFGSNALFDDDQKYNRNPQAGGIRVVKNNLKDIEDAINENTVGIFMETHQGEGGPLFNSKEHFLAIRKLTKDKKIFLGCDEIQTGLGRCGYLMAWQEFGEEARPDFVTLGKALGAGLVPVSMTVGTEEFMSILKPGSDGSTYGGYPLAGRVGTAVLNYIQRNDICKRATKIGDYFTQKLAGIPGIKTDHKGALIRVELEGVKTAKYACLEMLLGKDRNPRVFMKHGHYDPIRDVAYTRIAPPIGAMTEELIDLAVEKTIIPVLSQASRKK